MEHFPAQFNLPLEKTNQCPPIFLCCDTIPEKRWGWYPPELEVKETTGTASFASFLDLYLEFDDSGQLSTKIMINGTTSILKSYIFQICAAMYQLLLHMVFTSRN